MTSSRATIANRLGLHARAATQLVHCASAFAAESWIILGERRVNAKSIMGVLTLAATTGSEVIVEAEGQDAEDAVAAITELIRNKFGEDD